MDRGYWPRPAKDIIPSAVAARGYEGYSGPCSRGGFKLRSKIIGDPTFNCKLCGGMPGKSSEFKTLWENLLLRCRRKLYQ
ncbi:hypothetical protein EVAR_14411_1 [Eumeta japonica]|uniref:Uncharacterized protein n=1 Tax=Eumeta variegata TaxID=151549 RepID=A0A4C1TX59_EUMVA|nr:hypothetical protein EVAR_14411_1 [Eumeta japonica]